MNLCRLNTLKRLQSEVFFKVSPFQWLEELVPLLCFGTEISVQRKIIISYSQEWRKCIPTKIVGTRGTLKTAFTEEFSQISLFNGRE